MKEKLVVRGDREEKEERELLRALRDGAQPPAPPFFDRSLKSTEGTRGPGVSPRRPLWVRTCGYLRSAQY